MVEGSFSRGEKSDECGICKESHSSKKPVLKRECSHYFHVSCHKTNFDDSANNHRFMRHCY